MEGEWGVSDVGMSGSVGEGEGMSGCVGVGWLQ